MGVCVEEPNAKVVYVKKGRKPEEARLPQHNFRESGRCIDGCRLDSILF
jgi:hypothetical protein